LGEKLWPLKLIGTSRLIYEKWPRAKSPPRCVQNYTRKKREPQQTAFIKPTPPPVKNGDILDVDEAAALLKVSKKTVYNRVKANTIPYAKLGRKLLFHRQSLVQWIAEGGDRAKPVSEGEQLTMDRLVGMLNNGQARIASSRS
jgi:excisionase family DNA binding protein